MLKRSALIVLSILCIVAITACDTGAVAIPGLTRPDELAEDTPEPLVEDGGTVSAEAVVEPARWVDLRFAASGVIVEVLVAAGDIVETGQPLLRVEQTDTLLMVHQAEAALAAAQAELDLARAGTRPEQITVIEAQLAIAEASVAEAAGQRDAQAAVSTDAGLVAAQAAVVRARADYREVYDAHEDTLECFTVDLPDGSEREICPALGPYEETARHATDASYAALQAAQAQVDMVESVAQAELSEAQAVLLSAIHQRDALEAELERARSGSRPEEVSVVEARVLQTEVALAQARAMLEDTVVDATFAGTVVDVLVDPGDQVLVGAIGVTLATLDRLRVVTTDLTEYDVVDVAIGQPVSVWLDAVPDDILNGHVARIERQSGNRWGDVIFAVQVELDAAAPAAWRWGMTAQVEIARVGADYPSEVSPPAVIPAADVILSEAAVEPVQWTSISSSTGGTVVVLPVEPDTPVREGDVLVVFDPDRAQLAVEEAEAALASAQAALAVMEAGSHPDSVLAAEERLAAAQSAIAQAVAVRDKLSAGAAEAELAADRAALEAARFDHQQAQLAWQRADRGDDEDARVLARDRLAAAELAVTAAEQRLVAQPEISAARLSAAHAGVWAAGARRDAAQADLDLLKSGPRREELAAARAVVLQAEAALESAQVALERTEVHAPFDGVVTRVSVEVGDTVAPGQPMLVLAELSRLQVTTTDSTELDVVHLSVGNPVVVIVDALPASTLQGYISEIGLRGIDDQGDVVYPVTVELDEQLPELLWGMTVLVELGRDG